MIFQNLFFYINIFILAGMINGFMLTPKANAQSATPSFTNLLDELDPRSPDIEQQLQLMDQEYKKQTGLEPFIDFDFSYFNNDGCYRQTCTVWAQVSRREQKMYLYVNGNPLHTWIVSTGAPGMETPDFDTHPNGRIYDTYSSSSHPGEDYMGFGDMPYAVFIRGGYAVHGTAVSNWKYLGQPASHGCVRLHPDQAKIFNRLVRKHGVGQVWITVTE